jgi:hypothetical protein
MIKKIFILTTLILLASCFGPKGEDLKSPCVGLEKSPCGPKKPVNSWIS